MEPSQVQPGLFVGGIAALAAISALDISHVVSVVNTPGELSHPALPQPPNRHLVDVEDSPDANLLQLLPATVDFVRQALQGGGRVLVHCAAGVSRSVAVVMAYLMATQQGLTPAQALEQLRQAQPAAFPNAGFMRQLELFHAMGCVLRESHLPYKRFLLERLGRQYEETGMLDVSMLAQPEETGQGLARMYRCRKCRALLATSQNLVEVEQGPGASAFPWRKRDKQQRQQPAAAADWQAGGEGGEEGGSLFVEPLQWMAPMVVGGPVQGKLYCPKCQARLGSFNWSGSQSSSGTWVVPSFQLHTARVDTVDPMPPAPIHQPRMLLSSGAAPAGAVGSRQLGPQICPMGPSRELVAGGGGAAAGPQQQGPQICPMGPPREQHAAGGAGAAAGGRSGAEACKDGAHCTSATELAERLQQQVVLASAPAPASSSPGSVGRPHAAASSAEDADGSSPAGVAGAAGPLRFTHLILDCDGVMVDSERASCEALRQSILQVTGFDIPHSFPEDYQPVFGMDVYHCVEYYKHRFARLDWGDAAAVAAQVAEVKEGIYRELTESGIAAFEGVAELIQAAKRLGLGVAVASSGTPDKIRHNMSSSGLWGMVDEHLVVSAKYVPKGKPAPDVYLEALRRLGCQDASRALVVEDAVNGLKAAKAAGCFAVGITNSLPRQYLELFADAVIGVIGECETLLVQQHS